MPYEPNRYPRERREHREHREHREPRDQRSGGSDPALRELLLILRDTFRDAAARIDRVLVDGAGGRGERDGHWDRGGERGDFRGGERGDRGFTPRESGGDAGTRMPLEALREEARQISQDATHLDPAELRLRIEAVTAETRALQNRAGDPEDRDIAAKILRVLTAIVSEHRPGHVYGLARHHQADWDEVARRARQDLANGSFREAGEHAEGEELDEESTGNR
jgi:hypothetical protein